MKPISFIIFLLLPLSSFCQSIDSMSVRLELDSLKQLGNQFIDDEKWDDAAAVILRAEEVCLGTFSEESLLYAEFLNLEARLFLSKMDFQNTVDRSRRSMSILKRAGKVTHPAYMMNLLYLVEVAFYVGNYQDAQDLLEEVLPLAEKQWGSDHVQYLQYKMNLGILYRVNKQLGRSEEVLLEAIDGIERAMGRENEFYTSCLVNLGLLYSDIGDFENSERVYLEAKDFYEQILKSTEDPTYVGILQNLGILYWEQKVYDKAEPLYRQSLPIMKSLLGSGNQDYAGGLINLGLLYIDMRQYDQAEPLLQEAKTIFEDTLLNREHPYYLNGLHNLANVYRHTGKPDLAEQVNLNVLGIREKKMGKGHEDYAQSLVNLIYLYLETEQKDKAIPYTLALTDNIRHRLQVAFSFLSDREKEGFIRAKLEDQVALLQSAGVAIGSSQAGDMLYDLSLMMKGVRLQSGISTMEYVLEQQDTSAIGIYRNLLTMRNQLARQFELPVDQRSGIEQMEDQLDQMEKKLARLSASFRQDQSDGRLTHHEVKKALKPGELAIEFIQIPALESNQSDGARYAALVLSPEVSHVQIVPLCREEQLQTLLNGSSERRLDYVNELYSIADRGFSPTEEDGAGLYDLIWQPIEPLLTKGNTLYISPSGLLNRLNLGAIARDEETAMSDKYQIRVLSSTRTIAHQMEELAIREKSALVFGGVYYDHDSTAIDQAVRSLGISVEERQRARQTGDIQPVSRGSRSERKGWQYLKWTQKEGDKVNSLLSAHGFNAHFSTGFAATEEAFKLAGTSPLSPSTIHLATHGYFFPDQDGEGQEATDLNAQEPPMVRSGLLLAGANKAWKDGVQLPGFEDGILTAFEISQLNLTNTELVVLSACETGLGDIQGSEGVFGLQRAFKMSGVRYLIMSLWQVPDFQTQDLMTTFYAKWLEDGLAIPEAFRVAQLEMRDKYQSPYFWAGFVLVE